MSEDIINNDEIKDGTDETKAGRRLASKQLAAAREALNTLAAIVKWAGYEDKQPDDEAMDDEAKADDNMLELVTIGGGVKAMGDGKIGGYLVMYGDSDHTDLSAYSDYFTHETDFDLEDGSGKSTVLYHHGKDATLGKRKLGTAVLKTDNVGVWMDAQLKLRDDYERAIYQLVEAGKMGLSSGTAPHLVERKRMENGSHEITRWPLGLDASLTPIPAEPRTSVVPIKSYMAMAAQHVKALLPEDGAQKAASVQSETVATPEPAVEIILTDTTASDGPTKSELKMSDEIKQEVKQEFDQANAFKALQDQITALTAKMDNEPAINPSGVKSTVEVTKNEPMFKTFGGFLQAVAKQAQHGKYDERLQNIKSNDPLDESGFSIAKAMGPGFVGSLQATKAVSGMNETTPSDGGFLVGNDRAAGIMSRVYNEGQLLQRVDMVPISSGSNGMSFYAEDETSRADGSRRGGVLAYWAAEAATVTATQPHFREMNLRLHKLMALVYATGELLADASALEAWVMNNLPGELRFKAENAIFNGTGAGQPLGILNSDALVSVAAETEQAADTIVFENIMKMYSRMWTPSLSNAAWYISQNVWPQLYSMSLAVGTGGSAVYLPPNGLSAAPFGMLLGRPVYPIEYAPTLGTVGDIVFADMSQYQMIDKGGVQSDSSMHVRFLYDENVYRFIYRIDGQPKWNSPLTPYNAGDTVSPFVALATR